MTFGIKVIEKSQNSRNEGFSYFYCLIIEGSGIRLVPDEQDCWQGAPGGRVLAARSGPPPGPGGRAGGLRSGTGTRLPTPTRYSGQDMP
jgi:hypothetical protein